MLCTSVVRSSTADLLALYIRWNSSESRMLCEYDSYVL